MNNFDLKKFLTENKLTNNSKLLNENYRERNDNLQFIINVLKAGKTSPIIEIFEKIVEHNDNDNLDQEIDQAVEEVIDEDESLKKYLDYESSKGSMYYGDMKEVKAGDLDMEKLARIFEKGKKLRLLYAGTGFNTKQSMNDINLIGTIVSAGEEAFDDHFDKVEGLAQREIPVDLMPIDSIRDPKMKAAWEELAYALDFNAAAYEYEYPELEVYYNNLVDIVNNFPSEYLS